MGNHKPLSFLVLTTVLVARAVGAQPAPEAEPPAPALAAPVPAVPAAASPVLDVDTDVPGAVVSLDNALLGVTPLKVDVTPGPHELRVEVPGQAPQVRRVVVPATGTLAVQFATAPAAAAPAPAGAPAKPSVGGALKEAGLAALLDTPWVGMVVVAAVGTTVLAALLWTTSPSEIPFSDQLPSNFNDNEWRVFRFASLGVAGALGAVALLLLLLPSSPLAKLGAVVDAAKGQ